MNFNFQPPEEDDPRDDDQRAQDADSHGLPTPRAIAPRPDLLDTSMGGVRNLEGEAVRAAVPGVRRPSPAAEGGDAPLFSVSGHFMNGRRVTGVGYTRDEAEKDFHRRWLEVGV